MIVTCEECQTDYRLSPDLLGKTGRLVRCTRCMYKWFQKPEDVDSSDRKDDSVDEDVLSAILQNQQEEADTEDAAADDFAALLDDDGGDEDEAFDLSPPAADDGFPEYLESPEEQSATDMTGNWSVTVSGLLMMLVFALSFSALIVLNKPVMAAWPASASFYSLLGVTSEIKGEGLIFDQLKAVANPDKDGVYALYVTGNIVNLKKTPVAIPGVMASLKRKDGSPAGEWRVPVSAKKVGGEDSVSFSTSYPQVKDAETEVTLRFVLSN